MLIFRGRYHWSVEYFEDLRNVNHCEFTVMKQNPDSGKFLLQNQLRTWSELKRQKAQQTRAEEARKDPQRRNTLSSFLTKQEVSPNIPPRKWGGCVGGCNHNHDQYPRRETEQHVPPAKDLTLPPAAQPAQRSQTTPEAKIDGATGPDSDSANASVVLPAHIRAALYLHPGRDGGGGDSTPHESDIESDDSVASDFDPSHPFDNITSSSNEPRARRKPQRKPTVQDMERWATESGMGRGAKADPLGDEAEDEDEDDDDPDLVKAEAEDKGVRGSVY